MNNKTINIQNLSQLKKYFLSGGAIKMIFSQWCPTGKLIGVTRRPEKVQTNAVMFEGGSWLQYDKANCYDFKENGFDVYENTTLNPETNRHDGISHRIKLLSYEFINY